jgi:hypothetical protein
MKGTGKHVVFSSKDGPFAQGVRLLVHRHAFGRARLCKRTRLIPHWHQTGKRLLPKQQQTDTRAVADCSQTGTCTIHGGTLIKGRFV